MDPRQIFNNISEGNPTISFNMMISVIKEDEKYVKETTTLVAMSTMTNSFNRDEFVEVMNSMRRFYKEFMAVSDDNQQLDIAINYMFRMITNGSEGNVTGDVIKQRCTNALSKSKDMKKVVKRVLKNIDDGSSYDKSTFIQIAKEGTDASSSSSSSSSSEASSSDDEGKTFIEKATKYFDRFKEEGRNTLPLTDCLEAIQKAGLREEEIMSFLEASDFDEMGELAREHFILFVRCIEWYYAQLRPEMKDQDIFDPQYKQVFGMFLFSVANKTGQQFVESRYLKFMMTKLTDKIINNQRIPSIYMEGMPETVTFDVFVQYLSNQPPVEEQAQTQQQIPMSNEQIDLSGEDVVDYNPSKFTAFYLNCFISWIDAIFG